jgi:hypothetical protein
LASGSRFIASVFFAPTLQPVRSCRSARTVPDDADGISAAGERHGDRRGAKSPCVLRAAFELLVECSDQPSSAFILPGVSGWIATPSNSEMERMLSRSALVAGSRNSPAIRALEYL